MPHDQRESKSDTPRVPGGQMPAGQHDENTLGGGPASPKEKAVTRIDTEDEVAEASDESFPASDPPSFNPGHA